MSRPFSATLKKSTDLKPKRGVFQSSQ